MNKKRIIIKISVVLLILIILPLSFPQIRSYFIMSYYSFCFKQDSIMEKNGFKIDIPGGLTTKERDWYPFVMTFNDKNISSAIKEDIDLTILYNFGAFESGRSLFYKEDSNYYSAFYGAYVVKSKDKDRKYGFKNDQINIDEITKLASRDIETLVLRSIGYKSPKVSYQEKDSPKKLDYLSYDNWTMMDSIIYSQGPIHKPNENHRAYIQYGKPPADYQGVDFPPVKLYGRMYCRYFQEYDVTIIMYIIAPNFEILDKTDDEILSKTLIE